MYILFSALWLMLQPLFSQASNPETSRPGVIFTSIDGGQTWLDVGTELPGHVSPISIWGDGAAIYLGAADGVYRSNAALPSTGWKKEILLPKEIIGISPGLNGPYAVSLWNGFFQYQSATGLWQSMHQHLKDKTVYALHETTDGVIFVGGESGIHTSGDRGKTWHHSFDRGQVTGLAEHNGILMAVGNHGMWRSEDRGKEWSRVTVNVTAPFCIQAIAGGFVAIYGGQEIGGIKTPNTAYFSADGGLVWKPFASMPAALSDIYTLQQAGASLVACSGKGIFRSTDGGKTWEPVLSIPEGEGSFFKLIVSGGLLYALSIQGC